MQAILEANGDLLVPVPGGCVAALRMHPGDPGYAEHLADAIPAEALRPEPGENERLAAEVAAALDAERFGPHRRTA